MACPNARHVRQTEVLNPHHWYGPPLDESRRLTDDTIFTTLCDWYNNGPLLVRTTPGLRHVRIVDRSPLVVDIEKSTGLDRGRAEYEGRCGQHWGKGYGWMHGYRWMMEPAAEPCAAYHLPGIIHRHLPDCPYAAIVKDRRSGRGTLPRWGRPEQATEALNAAAWDWAANDGRPE
jgi:hypothetical protein